MIDVFLLTKTEGYIPDLGTKMFIIAWPENMYGGECGVLDSADVMNGDALQVTLLAFWFVLWYDSIRVVRGCG